jgi:hypothetical protein
MRAQKNDKLLAKSKNSSPITYQCTDCACGLRRVARHARRCTCLEHYLKLLDVVLKATNSEHRRCGVIQSSCIDIRSAQLVIRVHVCRPSLHLLQHIWHKQ